MAKLLKLQREDISAILEEIKEKLEKSSFISPKIEVVQQGKKDSRVGTLIITPNAWAKMMLLVAKYTTEIAWRGLIEKQEDGLYVVKDIVIYPQTVSGTTIITDYEKFDEWLESFTAEERKKMRFHGHSHVNMGVTPSQTDRDMRDGVISQIANKTGENIFYAFVIVNKSYAVSAEIFDISSNALFSTEDKSLEVCLMFEDETTDYELLNTSAMLVKQDYTHSYPKTKLLTNQNNKAKDYKGYKGYQGEDDYDSYWNQNRMY